MQQKQEQRTAPLPPKSSRLVVDPEPHPSAPPHTHEQGEDDIHVNPADPDDAGGQ